MSIHRSMLIIVNVSLLLSGSSFCRASDHINKSGIGSNVLPFVVTFLFCVTYYVLLAVLEPFISH